MIEHTQLFGVAQEISIKLGERLRNGKGKISYVPQLLSNPMRHAVMKKGIGDTEYHPIFEIFDKPLNTAVPEKFSVRVTGTTHLDDVIRPILSRVEKEKNITFEVNSVG